MHATELESPKLTFSVGVVDVVGCTGQRFAVALGSGLVQSQKATTAARETAERKFATSLS